MIKNKNYRSLNEDPQLGPQRVSQERQAEVIATYNPDQIPPDFEVAETHAVIPHNILESQRRRQAIQGRPRGGVRRSLSLLPQGRRQAAPQANLQHPGILLSRHRNPSLLRLLQVLRPDAGHLVQHLRGLQPHHQHRSRH